MNYLLDAFLASFIYGITTVLWFLVALFGVLYVIKMISSQDDDDDDDGGTLQPVYQGADK